MEYQQLPVVKKQQLFKGFVPFTNTMPWYFDLESPIQYFWFDHNLIEVANTMRIYRTVM